MYNLILKDQNNKQKMKLLSEISIWILYSRRQLKSVKMCVGLIYNVTINEDNTKIVESIAKFVVKLTILV